MSRTIPAAVQTMMDSGLVTRASCLKITTKAGTVYGFTDWTEAFTHDSQAYTPIGGYSPSDFSASGEMNVDNAEVTGYYDANGVVLSQVRGNEFDNAAYRIFTVNPYSLSGSEVRIKAGTLGRFKLGDTGWTAELRGLMQLMQQPIGSFISEGCRADIGDSICQVPIQPSAWSSSTAVTATEDGDAGIGTTVKPTVENGYYYRCTVAGTTNDTEGEPTWNTTPGGTTVEADGVEWETIVAYELTGTLTSVTDNANFADSSRGEADDWWGKITIDTGDNAGISMELKSYTQTGGVFETYLPFPFDIAGTEDYTVQVFCGKTRTTDCRDKFNNIKNMDAEPFTPGIDKVAERPMLD